MIYILYLFYMKVKITWDWLIKLLFQIFFILESDDRNRTDVLDTVWHLLVTLCIKLNFFVFSLLGFDAKEMYQFISERFIGTNVEVQRQALQWLQLLCLLNIQIPLEILFDMFAEGIKTLHKGPLVIGMYTIL